MAWLAFDIGTTQTKAVLMDEGGTAIRSTASGYATHSAPGGVVEQSAEDWWAAVRAASAQLALAPGEIDALAGIALTGQMQDLILLDAEGTPLAPVILYSDTRAIAEAGIVNDRAGADRLQALTGNAQDAGSLLAKLLWLSRTSPGLLRDACTLLLGAADFIAMRLTGAACTDSTTASTTGLLDLTTRRFLRESLLASLDLAHTVRLLPTVVAGGTAVGGLRTDAAEQLGLRPGIPVHLGPGDAGSATIGAGSGEPGHAYGYVGTSGWVAFTADERAAPGTGVFTLAHPRAGSLICVAPLLTAGGNLDWVGRLLGHPSADPAALVAEALRRPPGSLLYLPYLNGERSPFSDPLARGALVGLEARHDGPDLVRAVLEGVVYAYRHALDALLASPPGMLTLTGGGTRSAAWCQLFADILNVPIAIAEDAGNVGVRGAVIAAQASGAVGQPGLYRSDSLLRPGSVLMPDLAYHAHFDRQYALFRSAYPALKPIFTGLHEARPDPGI